MILEVVNNFETNYNGFNSQEQIFIDINEQFSLMNSSTILGTFREDSKDIINILKYDIYIMIYLDLNVKLPKLLLKNADLIS